MKPVHVLAFALSALPGCYGDGIESTDAFEPSELSMWSRVQSNGREIAVAAYFDAIDGDSLFLGEGDHLEVSAPDAPAEHLLPGHPGYGALIPTDATEIAISFVRDGQAVTAAVELPEPFALVVPSAPVSVGEEAIELSWNPGTRGDEMYLQLNGSCIRAMGEQRSLDDTGSYRLEPGEIYHDGEPCTLLVTLERLGGETDLALGAVGGSAYPAQVRTSTLEIVP
jgi:hypothetical protein